MTKLPNTFPTFSSLKDFNPAIRLFGNRFYIDQSLVELALEFLGIIYHDKWVDPAKKYITAFMPISEMRLLQEGGNKLFYNLPVKLNLKLFSFFSSSRIETRHNVHNLQYEKLIKAFDKRIIVSESNETKVIERIEELMRSFLGAGFNRTWCAKNFYPIAKGFMVKETLWNESVAKRNPVNSWNYTIDNINKYFSVSKHRFMARGGELLYLQICNALIQQNGNVEKFVDSAKIPYIKKSLEQLHNSLQIGFSRNINTYTLSLERLANFIELLDEQSHKMSNRVNEQSCEWCPQESWQEGYIFAIELNRILYSTLDPIDKLEMLITGCALQVLRSLCAQSVRYAQEKRELGSGGALGYAWIFSHPQISERKNKIASQRSLLAVQGLIQNALRYEPLIENAYKGSKGIEKYYKEADTRYGHKLFLSLGKKLGIIVPLKGPGARFVLTDKVVRYLILATLDPGSKCTYDEFLRRIYTHFGIAVEGEQLHDAMLWTGLPIAIFESNLSWFSEMLRAGGFLIELSDSCSIVNNPFGEE